MGIEEAVSESSPQEGGCPGLAAQLWHGHSVPPAGTVLSGLLHHRARGRCQEAAWAALRGQLPATG